MEVVQWSTKLVWALRAADLLANMAFLALAAVYLERKEPCLETLYMFIAMLFAA